MSTRVADPAWSGRFRALTTTLTVIGILGLYVYIGVQIGGVRPGCALGSILFALVFGVILLLYAIGVLAVVGIVLLNVRSRWGPLLLVPTNLLVTSFFGWWWFDTPGQVGWTIAIIVLSAVPVLAAILLLKPLMSRGRPWVRLTEFVVLGALAVPMLLTYGTGVTSEIMAAQQPVPAPVAASTTSPCGGTTADSALTASQP